MPAAFPMMRYPWVRTEAALLLTKRADALRNHAGQWALPGGRIDAGETPEQAALRELHEEVGLRLGEDSLLGRLDDFVTRSGYVITPVLVWAGAARELVPNPHEVRSIHRIPVSEFLRVDAPMLENRGSIATPQGQTILAAGANLREAMELAQAAASVVVHQLGTTGVAPAAELRKRLFSQAI